MCKAIFDVDQTATVKKKLDAGFQPVQDSGWIPLLLLLLDQTPDIHLSQRLKIIIYCPNADETTCKKTKLSCYHLLATNLARKNSFCDAV